MIKLIDGSNLLHRTMYDLDHKKLGIHPIRELYLRFMMADHNTIIVWDGISSNARRREVYPGYKMNRSAMSEDISSSFKIMKQILQHCPVTQIEIPRWEADDVLYTVALESDVPVTIETNDSDFWQIADEDDVSLPLVKPLPCLPCRTCVYKSLVGDPSDNIKGWRGFGPKRWEAVSHLSDEIQRCLQEEDYNGWLHIPWPKGVIADYGTFFELCTYYKVVQMQLVPQDEFNGNVTIGISNHAAAEEVLSEFKI